VFLAQIEVIHAGVDLLIQIFISKQCIFTLYTYLYTYFLRANFVIVVASVQIIGHEQ